MSEHQEPKSEVGQLIRDLLERVEEDAEQPRMAELAGALKDELLRRGWCWDENAQDYLPPSPRPLVRVGSMPCGVRR